MRTWSFILFFCFTFLLKENCVAQVRFDYSFFQFLLKENALSSATEYLNSFENTDSILYCHQLLALQTPAPSSHTDFLPTFSDYNNLLQNKTAALSYYNTHKTNNRQFSNKNNIDTHYICFYQACIAADQNTFERFYNLYSQHKILDSLHTNLALEEAWNALEEAVTSHTSYKAKNKYTAGLLSIVPGLGKVYLGKKRQALSTFAGIALLSLETWEAYEKGGPASPLFIGFGSLTALFYLGNIYGTLRLNKASRSKQNRTYHEKIMAIMGPMLVE